MNSITDFLGKLLTTLHNSTDTKPVDNTTASENPSLRVVAIPDNMREIDLTDRIEKLETKLAPWRRTGTAHLQDLESLIAWANRNKGESSALFATVSAEPSLTCIADYHLSGAPEMDYISRDPKASHCRHRAHYAFPLSQEWKIWTKQSGALMNKAELGAFVEANAKDMLTPSAALINNTDQQEPWERNMQLVAQAVRGRFGTPDTLINLSRRFEVNETSNITTSRNPDTGETSFNFVNQHQQPDGSPVQIANLFLIALPVFENGALYRIPVRFRYQKSGQEVKFALTLHNPELALRDAVEEALTVAKEKTGLPLFRGKPEVSA